VYQQACIYAHIYIHIYIYVCLYIYISLSLRWFWFEMKLCLRVIVLLLVVHTKAIVYYDCSRYTYWMHWHKGLVGLVQGSRTSNDINIIIPQANIIYGTSNELDIRPINVKSFSCKQSKHSNVVPQLPLRGVLLAPSGAGKTVLLANWYWKVIGVASK